ncbi:MAG TPA: bifunctional adenosylcobinamide kinase/adenosylcobinamide-phosphate guanylyltransferase [Ktedonobacteraceae bacterium]|nr:bifunctional adenosylcobinamide kinase/adenosylcobinamide-phosphate guanylyltransferase [Ktedonobacteraceae bacterium]
MLSDQMTPPRLILILGGARSGKSTFAERLATRSGKTVAFIATATDGDDEMHERIIQHRASRPREWLTIEEPLDLVGAVQQAFHVADVAILDCVTLWLGNMLLQEQSELQSDDQDQVELHFTSDQFHERTLQHIEELLAVIQRPVVGKTLIIVSNEVGLGIVPAYQLGRIYRDTLGYVNQRLAQIAERVYLMVAGMVVDIKSLHQEASL